MTRQYKIRFNLSLLSLASFSFILLATRNTCHGLRHTNRL